MLTKATCIQDGSKERVCECGEKEIEVFEAIGHNITNDYCINCGRVVSMGLEYELFDSTSYCLMGLGTCSDTDIIIPSSYKGKSVRYIGDAFYQCTGIKSVTIPASVIIIGGYAFEGCTNLQTVIFEPGSQLTDIYTGAFFECTSLISIKIPNGVKYIYENAFYGCESLTSITIPVGLTHIEDEAFGWCLNLTSVYYEGTEEQWKNISIGDENEYLTSATITYNYKG